MMSRVHATLMVLLVGILFVGNFAEAEKQWLRSKRQAQIERPISANQRPGLTPGQLNANVPSGANATGTAFASSQSGSAQPPNTGAALDTPPDNRPSVTSRPGRVKVRPRPVDLGPTFEEDEEPAELPPIRRRPTARPQRRPLRPNRPMEDPEEDEDCDDYGGDDYDHVFHSAFAPMRQLGHIMGDMFEHMHGLASGDYQDFPDGNYALASSRSADDGYSRQSSIVRNNGRTRGIVSETRNGRTQTRRIGRDDDDDDNE